MKKKIKKIIPYCLILVILLGLFGLGVKVNAQAAEPNAGGVCYLISEGKPVQIRYTQATCDTISTQHQWLSDAQIAAGIKPSIGGNTGIFTATISGTCSISPITDQSACVGAGGTWTPDSTTSASSGDNSAFAEEVGRKSCILANWVKGTVEGCILQFVYWTFYTLGGWLLAIAASFFNYFIKITLSSELLNSDFISHAWGIVRDLSNIFFILILLYIAIKIILSLGGTEVKKMIANVVIMALLINFSMFMTRVVIDTSNILALIFYNKINTTDKKSPNAVASLIDLATNEKDLAGGLTQSFNPVYKLDSKFFAEAGNIKTPAGAEQKGPVSTAMLIGITVVAGTIMIFAAYALFISALAFLGRLIELFMLIIASPFAFMSFALPPLKSKEYIGWDSWLKRLLDTAFMAPIFMFFLYFIFLLLDKSTFTDSLKPKGAGTVATLLSILIPALIILTLLLKATSFAKKGSGQLGEAIIKGGTIAAGLGLGIATGGAALALRGTAGRAGAAVAESGLMKKWEARGFGGGYARSAAKAIGTGSFDIRGAKIGGQTLASATGIPMGEAQKGGFTQARKEKVEKRRKRAEELKVGEDEKLKQALNKTEADLQGLLGDNAKEIETVDKLIEKKRQEVADAQQQFNAGQISQQQLGLHTDELANAKKRKTALVTGTDFTDPNSLIAYNYSTTARTSTGGTIDGLEKQQKSDAQVIKTENARRGRTYANQITRANRWTKNITKWSTLGLLPGLDLGSRTNREAASEIRKGTKLDSGTKT